MIGELQKLINSKRKGNVNNIEEICIDDGKIISNKVTVIF